MQCESSSVSSSCIIPGPAILSKVRHQQLFGNVAVRAFYLHFVLGKESRELKTLLRYGSKQQNILDSTDQFLLKDLKNHNSEWKMIFVFPRPGTISPWSSKASDIAKICALDVDRIERGEVYFVPHGSLEFDNVAAMVCDRMTHVVFNYIPSQSELFPTSLPRPLKTVALVGDAATKDPKAILQKSNLEWGLALAEDEIEYLVDAFLNSIEVPRNPTDVELMMFAQVNSEHCRHKIFGATWTIDGVKHDTSLFAMIKNTYELHPEYILSAYSDNAAVLVGPSCFRFAFDHPSKIFSGNVEPIHTLIKVETHNHPTAVSPFAGAATGSGGEIRDEAAVGQGSKTKAGLVGFSVSNLNIPGFEQPWESLDIKRPKHIASALDIMIKAPLGAAAFNNEFGRPGINGYFRTFLLNVPVTENTTEWRGYHKPIMIAGGMGTVRPMHTHKGKIPAGSLIIVLGGPSMLIGLGGGAASSMAQGQSSLELDFASVQRGNPEMERRAQMVIDTCTSLGTSSPIIAIHDVGAGGLSNALPELVHDSDMGAIFQLRDIPCADTSMSPMEIWCNESQERYVLAISPESLSFFSQISQRERCPFAVVGIATIEKRLLLVDSLLGNNPIDLPMKMLFGKPPKMHRVAHKTHAYREIFKMPQGETLFSTLKRVLSNPTVASKSFLITIADRTVTGLVARDQFVGPWQTPVADVSVILSTYDESDNTGQAMAMGERSPIALISAAASARMAVAESLTNIAAAYIGDLKTVRLSANWMSAASHDGEGAALYEAVQAVGLGLCPELGLTIPVGKDSMSMRTKWEDDNQTFEVASPLSLIVTAFGPALDATKTLTPQFLNIEGSLIVFIDLAQGKKRLGGSCLAQVYSQIGAEAPDVEDAGLIRKFWHLIQSARDCILAYHDRSDGGLITTILEMCFAGRVGAKLDISNICDNDHVSTLFNEELGAVIQIRSSDMEMLKNHLLNNGLSTAEVHHIGIVTSNRILTINDGKETILKSLDCVQMQRVWSETSFRIQSLRDNPLCAQQEYDTLLDPEDAGLHSTLTFDASENICARLCMTPTENRPRIAILREQGIAQFKEGVNSNIEMAYAFYQAGFTSVDVHMSDLLGGLSLNEFSGLAFPGGFSYGDVLGAGAGWAKSALFNQHATSELRAFFNKKTTFAIGVCNGCQMLSQLVKVSGGPKDEMIAGTSQWPTFQRNKSEQFEARTCLVKISSVSSSIFFAGMHGSVLPIAVAHGEGRVEFETNQDYLDLVSNNQIALQYVKSNESIAEPDNYPANPNGSVNGIAGVCSLDGRVLALMPHPERVIRGAANTWTNVTHSGWKRIFYNARVWVDSMNA